MSDPDVTLKLCFKFYRQTESHDPTNKWFVLGANLTRAGVSVGGLSSSKSAAMHFVRIVRLHQQHGDLHLWTLVLGHVPTVYQHSILILAFKNAVPHIYAFIIHAKYSYQPNYSDLEWEN